MHSSRHIAENIGLLKKEIPEHVKLVVVTKTITPDIIKDAYDAGQRAFGENRVQELLAKYTELPSDIEWHLIGHLQTNKVKFVVPFIHLIHSVDSLKLLAEINKEAGKINRTTDCLLQIHIAQEETKFGLSCEEAWSILNSNEFKEFRNVRITGLMGMTTFTENTKQIEHEFALLTTYFKEIKDKWFSSHYYFRELSMGMSGDYKLALAAGSTIIRIGSLIFGERKLTNK